MEINQVIKKIRSENHGFYIIETQSVNLEDIEENIKKTFYQKQYEIDTSFINLVAEDGAKNISIEQIRKLKKEFLHTNVLEISRVILISEINNLNINSINALLKLIEEIPSNTFFIFCTSNLLKIPETIISRARLLRLNNYQDQSGLELLASDITNQNQNIPENIVQDIIDPFLKLKKANFFENVKFFNKDQLDICSIIFLKVLNHYLKLNFNNKKLYKYLYELHSSYIYDIDESIKFNTLTNDLIAIYFTRLNSNLIKYAE
tara:strand:+ start:1068 stop:1853 length:786 start_codon:yes stop_codon:yes gene_type:complete